MERGTTIVRTRFNFRRISCHEVFEEVRQINEMVSFSSTKASQMALNGY